MASFPRIVLMVLFWLAIAAGGSMASPQTGAPASPSTTVPEELRAMARQAGIIFAGQVVAVRQPGPETGLGWVEVEFRIDEAVRGCAGQPSYILREWAGLWAGGARRYTVGQRLLMMLHAPGPSGLSSPVGGPAGAIPLVGKGAAPGPNDSFTAAAEPVVDTRWVETRLLRPDAGRRLRAHPVVPTLPAIEARPGTGAAPGPAPSAMDRTARAALVPVPGSLAGVAADGMGLSTVLSLLRAPEAERVDAAR